MGIRHDTGLLCHLLSSGPTSEMERSGTLGQVFENAVISELYKRHMNQGKAADLYFYRDSNGVEVDLLDATVPSMPELCEIKSSRTFRGSFMRHLDSVGDLLGVGPERRSVIMRSDRTTELNGSKIWAAENWAKR